MMASEGLRSVTLTKRLRPGPVVGDWLALVDGEPVAVLQRQSLLQRLAARAEVPQPLAANVDVVWLVCGLDRPVKSGRLAREASLAWDAGATPTVVLTKAARHPDPEEAADGVRAALPGTEVLITSVLEHLGIDVLRQRLRGLTTTMVGESGAGKSTLLNAVLGEQVAATGRVREGDSKGRHTTTTRELHLVPTGGSLIDMPGIRSVGLVADVESVARTFADVTELADGCRFGDCNHDREPGCAVRQAVDEGGLDARRLAAWRELSEEAAASADVGRVTDARGRRSGGHPESDSRAPRWAPNRRPRR